MNQASTNVALLVHSTRGDVDITAGLHDYIDRHQLPWQLTRIDPAQTEGGTGPSTLPLPGRKYDAVIGFIRNPAQHAWAIAQGGPIVQLAAEPIDYKPAIIVRTDDNAVGLLAAQHLIDQGFRHFAHERYREGERRESRLKAFTRHVEKAGYACTSLTPKAIATSEAEADLTKTIKEGPLPLAAFFHQDQSALYFLQICQHHGLQVPDDVAILGVDNIDICQSASCPMSSIVIPWRHIGNQAAQYLHRMLSGAQVPQEHLIQPMHVVHRRSTRSPKPSDPLVERALLLLERDHAKDLRIEDLARKLKLDRTRLYRRFVASMGHSPSEALHRIRIAKAKNLLVQRDLTIDTIMRRIGYPCRQYFNRVFKARTGVTPTAFRQGSR